MTKRTYQPKKKKSSRFLTRNRKQKNIIKARRKKGRQKLS